MTMLSGPLLPNPRRRPPLPNPPPLRQGQFGIALPLGGGEIEALAEGGLWIAAERALIVSDLHLEKGSSFARRGQMLPPYDTRTTLARLEALAAKLQPQMIVSLGDSFHDAKAHERLDCADADRLQALTAACDFVWILGNHDPEPPTHLGGRVLAELTLPGCTLRHEPTGAPHEIAGHLHPCAKVAGRGRAVRARCFATDGARLIMPAFGAFTGGLNVCDPAFAPIFPLGAMALVMGRERLYPMGPERLIGDR